MFALVRRSVGRSGLRVETHSFPALGSVPPLSAVEGNPWICQRDSLDWVACSDRDCCVCGSNPVAGSQGTLAPVPDATRRRAPAFISCVCEREVYFRLGAIFLRIDHGGMGLSGRPGDSCLVCGGGPGRKPSANIAVLQSHGG